MNKVDIFIDCMAFVWNHSFNKCKVSSPEMNIFVRSDVYFVIHFPHVRLNATIGNIVEHFARHGMFLMHFTDVVGQHPIRIFLAKKHGRTTRDIMLLTTSTRFLLLPHGCGTESAGPVDDNDIP